MAEYKVIQDIEAEDKLLGPLTLRQFIYAAIVVAQLGIMYYLAQSAPVLIVLFVLPTIFFGALAAPIGGAQSSEVWLLAKIRFFIKPRKRIWSQDGLQELVTITAPKKVEKHLTDDLSKTEVKSRLTALANTLDSRGWAIKNAYSPAQFGASQSQTADDRLLDTGDAFEAEATDQTVDVMDESTSDVAKQFQDLIQQSTQTHRAAVMDQVQNPQAAKQKNQPDYWFMSSQPSDKETNYKQKTILPGVDDDTVKSHADDSGQDEQAFLDKRHREEQQTDPGYSHLKTLQPIDKQKRAKKTESKPSKQPQAENRNPDIMRLASNDDLNVSTIAREANRTNKGDDDEVVISLH